MTDPILQAELLQHFGGLPLPLQQRVVNYARELGQKKSVLPPGTPGRDLLKFAGTISKEDAELMRRAIEEGCEQISDEW